MKLDVCLFLWEPTSSLNSSVKCRDPGQAQEGAGRRRAQQEVLRTLALKGPMKLPSVTPPVW